MFVQFSICISAGTSFAQSQIYCAFSFEQTNSPPFNSIENLKVHYETHQDIDLYAQCVLIYILVSKVI